MAQPDTFSYGPHELQKVHVYRAQEGGQGALWVIYIHGGAYRDKDILADSFSKTYEILNKHPMIHNNVAAFASIDYRLSPHPNSPQDPVKTPKSRLRNAMHPDHLNDVQAALKVLQEKYAFQDQYVLVGHSVGATMSFQAVMNKVQGADPTSIASPKPRAVVGVCGIYDLRLIRNDFKEIQIYDEFLKGALGPDEELWDRISPGKVADSDGVASGWQNGQLAVLANSTGDLVVNKHQADVMVKILEQWKSLVEGRDVVELYDLREGHDDVWQKGEELANVIITTIKRLARNKDIAC
ncbi:hypothetical protein UA08_05471 [Talaromyces atroroseus]|uniref:Kynurenine formamidase n=1 Tax=Talaromyces atroroseus TaxID=1441469 RepID=A0A225AWU5_TALAT|nr:hypothetical protein UA08_05471 [Talaromyces atroroseus]OKL58915.1 hypothetical protein UA08_05471 [Talaromyces atroroseus]